MKHESIEYLFVPSFCVGLIYLWFNLFVISNKKRGALIALWIYKLIIIIRKCILKHWIFSYLK